MKKTDLLLNIALGALVLAFVAVLIGILFNISWLMYVCGGMFITSLVLFQVYDVLEDRKACVPQYTCHDCVIRQHCEYTDDAYNTNGDCLASK